MCCSRSKLAALACAAIVALCAGCGGTPTADVRCPSSMRGVGGGEVIMGGGWIPLVFGSRLKLSPYCMDEHEVTVAEYAECVRRQQCSEPKPFIDSVLTSPSCNWNAPKADHHPINCVSWQQAHSYCASVGKELPTEAQWETAARGGPSGSRGAYPWGSSYPTDADACWNISNTRKGTCPVASFPATSLGLRDMAGNVSEWVFDWYGEYPSRADDYRGPAQGQTRVSRGGSWMTSDPGFLKTSARNDRPADYAGDGMGFRCATTPSG